jgi:hypothetical protein
MPSPQGDVRLARLGGPESGVRRVVLVVAVFLAIAIAKPWGWASGPDDHRTARASRADAAPSTGVPTVPPLRLAHSVLLTSASILQSGTAPVGGDVACYPSTGWRIATIDGTGVDRLRTWYSLVPGWESGPTDAGIPLVRVFARDLVALGFCAPTTDAQSIAMAGIQGWHIAGGRAVPIDLARLAGSSPRDLGLGSLFGPPPSSIDPLTAPATATGPATSGAASWLAGRYVFLIRAGQADEEDIWFGVDVVRIVDSPAGRVPSPGAPIHASP